MATRCLPANPEPGTVVTVIVWKFAALDLVYKRDLGWALLRVLKNPVP